MRITYEFGGTLITARVVEDRRDHADEVERGCYVVTAHSISRGRVIWVPLKDICPEINPSESMD